MKKLLLIALLPGCFWATTKSEGESMRKDIKTLQDQMSTKQKELDDQIAKLNNVLEESSKLLKRNSADLGADVDALRNDVREAKGIAATMQNTMGELKLSFDAYRKSNDDRLSNIEQRLGQIESGKPTANSSPDDLWKLGSQAYEAARYKDAIDIFQRLSSSFPTHERADDALYFRGQAHTKIQEWEKAISVFQILFDKFPQGELTDDGLYFAALAAQQLKQCTEARTYLGIINSKFPKSNVKKQASDLDASIKKELKNKSKCSS